MTYPLKPIPFSWSWTALKNYRSCPKKHFETAILKNYKDVRSEALSWGDAFHEAMAKRLTTKRLLPPDYQKYEKLAKWVEERADGGQLRIELQLAINRHHVPTGYFDPDVWYRAKLDVLIIHGAHAILIDWKTGKIEHDTQQLALNAACIFAYWPDIQTVTTQYVWVAHVNELTKSYEQTEDRWRLGEARYEKGEEGSIVAVNSLPDMWSVLTPELISMERAYAERNFPATPNRLCKNYCPVIACVHNGRHP